MTKKVRPLLSQLVNASGQVIKTYEYDAFGNELNPDSADANPFRYCGEYYDAETRYIYLRARYYSPRTGRFITEDPIRDGLNWYVYCSSNPVNFVDPWGLAAGDSFETVDAAAIDFGEEYYSTTDYVMLELATLIYSYEDEDGNIVYSYVMPVIGEPHSVQPLDVKEDIPDKATIVAAIHQHPNNEYFSQDDRNWAQQPSINIPLYVVTPYNTLRVWEKSIGYNGHLSYDGEGNVLWSERIVSTDLCIKGLSIAEKISLTYTYKNRWLIHTYALCDFKCSHMTWPRTNSNYVESWDVSANDYVKKWMDNILKKRYKQ